MSLSVCISGANGNVGKALVHKILTSNDFLITGAVGKRSAGSSLKDLFGNSAEDITITATVNEAYKQRRFDILIDYTTPQSVEKNVLDAISLGVHSVIGTSGIDDQAYERIDEMAKKNRVGVFAAGNFSITATLLSYFSQLAAKHIPHWEIFDYGSNNKKDAPSGTARELSYQLGKINTPDYTVSRDRIVGDAQSRGANINGSQVHSVRLPGYYSSAEVVFGLPGERLSIRHDSMSYSPYVEGTLLAAKKVGDMTGLTRGMDKLLDLSL